MGSTATTIQEQIAILEQRGLKLDTDHSKNESYLLDIGYYRLGFYLFPYETSYPDKNNRQPSATARIPACGRYIAKCGCCIKVI